MKKFFIGLLAIGSLSSAFADHSRLCEPNQFRQMVEDEYIMGIESCIKEQKIYVNHRYTDNVTPLAYAALAGKINSVKKLIELDANINVKDVIGNTVLHYAHFNYTRSNKAPQQVLSVVKFLVSKGVPINLKSENQVTPVELAVFNGFFESASYLLSIGVKRTYQLFEYAALRASKENISFLEDFFKDGFSVIPPEDKKPILSSAVCNPEIEVLKYFISKGAVVTIGIINHGIAHCSVIREKHLSYLIDLETDISLNPTILFSFIEMGKLNDLIPNLKKGYSSSRERFNKKLLPLMKKTLEKGANANTVHNGRTPLILLGEAMGILSLGYSTEESDLYLSAAKLLLEFGADKTLKDAQGNTAHDLYVNKCRSNDSWKGCNPEIVKVLKP